MKKKLWFRAKTYGWGWTPATWQGWAVTGIFVLYILCVGALIGDAIDSRAGLTSYLFLTFLATVLLLAVCYKFGEEPRWRWGNKKKK